MEEEYQGLLKSGMFWEFYPHLTGDYEKDKEDWKELYNHLITFRMKHKIEYEAIRNAQDSLRQLTGKSKSNLKPNVEPKPILFVKVPEYSIELFKETIPTIEKKINDAGWFLLYAFTSKNEYEIQSFTLKDSQEIELEKLKEQIINAIKGE